MLGASAYLMVFGTSKMDDTEFTVIIPCFNEENAIKFTVSSIRKNLADAGPYEMIVVNDGSTDRTKEICEEKSSLEIAESLSISANTVETHRSNILLKVGVKNTAGLVKWAIENEIV